MHINALRPTIDFRAFAAPRIVDSSQLKYRVVSKNDLDEVMRIESQAFEYPWSRDEFEYCLKVSECEGIVVEQGDAIVGYLFYEVRNGFYRLLSFAVDERKRRKGVGSFMLGVLADKLDAERVEISCFVREKNVQAQLFLRSLGYQTVWAVKGFYRETYEDARRMTFRRNERAAVADFARRHRLAG